MSIDIVPAHLAVQAMRDNGYKNAAYAIAELMDNSIQAGATQVELLCAERSDLVEQRRRSRIHQLAVLDNGCGMNADVLKIALQFGNGTHLTPDKQDGMGRFGMGLPSASISQCTRVEVWSWQASGPDHALYTYLDVDEIRSGKQKNIPEPQPKALPPIWGQVGKAFGPSGTLVVWSNLDRIMWRTATAIIDNSELLVGRMYRRFLHSRQVSIRFVTFDSDGMLITPSVREALPNDPLYLMQRTSCPAPFNQQPMFEPWTEHDTIEYRIKFQGAEHPVTLRFAVAKAEARQSVTAGSTNHGQHAGRNIGVSIMRAGRELDLDQSWTIKYDPRERWWGIEIEFPPALDELFGVTNNKQAARNFAELTKLDLDALLKEHQTVSAAMQALIDEGDPRAPLLEIAHRIQVNLKALRRLIEQQGKGKRSTERRYDDKSPETIATKATRERQDEGYQGASDHGETLPAAQRTSEIEQTLVDEGFTVETAHELAATTVNQGLKYLFATADIETPAFFTVKPRGGALMITLNVNHPAYHHLVEVLEQEAPTEVAQLQERLERAASGLKLLLAAWARYEDEQPDGRLRNQTADARNDWGRLARRFLERDE
ncbi:MAG: ATP-binding protein [Oscillochloridaceae bacterium umkhey_bin13]